jgi:hypothetical protein
MVVLNHNLLRLARVQIARCGTKTDYSDGLLGSVMVKSTRPWQVYGDRPPVSETLSFDMPAHSALHHFDEVTIVFRSDPARTDFGAKIGIERFVLVPRGL